MSEFDLSCLEDKDKVESLKIDIKLLNEEIKTLKKIIQNTTEYIKEKACYDEIDKKCKCGFSSMALDNTINMLKGNEQE